jgi:hypothetical protein
MKNNITRISNCCQRSVYPYFAYEVDKDYHIEKIFEGYRCVKCGKICSVIIRISDNKRI